MKSRRNPRLAWPGRVALAASYACLSAPFGIVTCLFVTATWAEVGELLFPLDDAWIHFEIARNLASGNGFSFNPGHPIAASTAPLYTVALAALIGVGASSSCAAYSIALISTVATIALAHRLAVTLTSDRSVAALAASLVAVQPWVVWSALSGMEIPLGSMLFMCAATSWVASSGPGTWRAVFPPIWLALACLVRPETYAQLALYFVVDLVWSFLVGMREGNRPRTYGLFAVRWAVVVFTLAPYALFSRITGTSYLPNTYTAKVGEQGLHSLLLAVASPEDLLRFSWERLYSYGIAFGSELWRISRLTAVLLPLSTLLLVAVAMRDRRTGMLLLPGLLVMFIIGVGIVVPVNRISYPWPRHMLHLLPLMLTWAVVTPFLIVRDRWGRALLTVTILLTGSLTVPSEFARSRDFFIDRVRKIQSEHMALARWVASNVSHDAVIAASDIGIFGYVTDNVIVDTEALIDPQASRLRHSGIPSDRDLEVAELLRQKKPDYLFRFVWTYPTLPSSQFPELMRAGRTALYETPWTRSEMKAPHRGS